MSKMCSVCKNQKSLDDFYFKKDRGKHASQCKSCTKDRAVESVRRNKEKVTEYKADYYQKNKTKIRSQINEWQALNEDYLKEHSKKRYQENKVEHRSRGLIKRYGIDSEEYNHMLLEQGGTCKICKSPDHKNKRVKFFAVDHNHETGQVRGLLCHSCNRAIGLLQDKVEIIEAAAEYIRTVEMK